MNWISVDERLPERFNPDTNLSDVVFVWMRFGYASTAYLNYSDDGNYWTDNGEDGVDVEYWAEIHPPKN